MARRNPIPSRIRGHILVAAIVTGAATGTITGAMVALDASPEWIAVASSALAAVGTVAASLSRANLTLDDTPESP